MHKQKVYLDKTGTRAAFTVVGHLVTCQLDPNSRTADASICEPAPDPLLFDACVFDEVECTETDMQSIIATVLAHLVFKAEGVRDGLTFRVVNESRTR